ncbi:prepilin-type N-terminal cleavage/methylation domain-containing protein [Nostocaceae cyanobacterium CENA369]|uniref:Prepilin-type N-terminal cleavage/methylation domain-containing protein n=1 Tax=Dendronalium phyllosphericum CENA369 TaxID=1725256 RepID=A0A8J7I1E5_9NOST|nr:hormogonium polysaccharide secretion pseudopilin HpsC [Dendronalium phyllosphericum]MBH8574215.1 prepilin-type N-terminal cleavage/methylation domain-containing protein [Dendronalium phyllosphericum CENA369]
MRALKFLLNIQLKRSKGIQQVGGFTLIELLVAIVLAFLVIAPLLGFMINVMSTDRQEQAKANSEQEIQAALDYIARDLQQAIYIYDATGVDAIKAQLPDPSATDRVPVLVFWKRELVNQAITVTGSDKDDAYVYSLVAYYLIKDTNTTWSNAARIARWQIKDGIASNSGVACTGYTGKYISGYCPSGGFALFNLDGVGTIEEKMNKWTRLSQYTTKNSSGADVVNNVSYSDTPIVLVDFIDQTITGAPGATTCPTGSSKVTPTSFNTINTGQMTSFYACVDRINTTAQVFLRGNAIARLQKNNLDYTASKSAYFPTASIRVQGRGYLFTK